MVPSEWLGSLVGARYRIVEHLASGGMGHVFLARDCDLQRWVAVKLLRGPRSAEQVHAFLRESRLLAQQDHPNIVRVFDSGLMDDGTPYLVMQYVAAEQLTHWLPPRLLFSHVRLLRVLRQLAAAIDHLHAQGIVHRDIKPANVLVDEQADDAVTLVDFGIAVREAYFTDISPGMVGTPTYMAPEQASGARITRAVDVYALGALALELLTGRPPYESQSMLAVLYSVMHERPRSPSTQGLTIAGLDAVLARALARDPRVRFTSATEFVDALERVLLGQKAGAQCLRPRTSGAQRLRRTPCGQAQAPMAEVAHGLLRCGPWTIGQARKRSGSRASLRSSECCC